MESSRPACRTRCANTPAAVGDRQMLPVQTNRMDVFCFALKVLGIFPFDKYARKKGTIRFNTFRHLPRGFDGLNSTDPRKSPARVTAAFGQITVWPNIN